MNSETRLLRAVLGRMLLAAVFAVAAGTTAPAAAEPGENPCELALSFVCHFVPTSSSWLNLVERWFGELTSKRIRRDSFGSVADLKQAIDEFLLAWNENPRPFLWTATVDSIVEKLSRCRQTLEQIQPGCTLPRSRKKKK